MVRLYTALARTLASSLVSKATKNGTIRSSLASSVVYLASWSRMSIA